MDDVVNIQATSAVAVENVPVLYGPTAWPPVLLLVFSRTAPTVLTIVRSFECSLKEMAQPFINYK